MTGQLDRAYTDALMALKLQPAYPPALRLKRKLEDKDMWPCSVANASFEKGGRP